MYLQVYHADVTRRPKHFGISCEFSRNRWQQRAGPTHRDRDTRNEEKRTSARVRSTNQYDKKYTETKRKRRNALKLKNKKKDEIKNNDIEEQKEITLGL